MKTFEDLFKELTQKVKAGSPHSGTVKMIEKGQHEIGKKMSQEAGEVSMAAE